MEGSALQQIREKEHELVELIAAAHHEGAEMVAQAGDRAAQLLANAATEARAAAQVFLAEHLVAVDQEAQTIRAQLDAEQQSVRRLARERKVSAVEFAFRCVVPGISGEGEL